MASSRCYASSASVLVVQAVCSMLTANCCGRFARSYRRTCGRTACIEKAFELNSVVIKTLLQRRRIPESEVNPSDVSFDKPEARFVSANTPVTISPPTRVPIAVAPYEIFRQPIIMDGLRIRQRRGSGKNGWGGGGDLEARHRLDKHIGM